MKWIVYLLALVIVATTIVPGASAQRIIFEDDLTEWREPWEQPRDGPSGSVFYEDEELHIMDNTDDNFTSTTLQRDFDDFTLTIETELSAGNEDAWQYIFTRLQEGGGYAFAINSDGLYQIQRLDGGMLTNLTEPTPSEHINIGRDAANLVRIECNGDELNFFVNGRLLESLHDTEFGTGRIALAAFSLSGSSSTVSFDDLVITEPT